MLLLYEGVILRCEEGKKEEGRRDWAKDGEETGALLRTKAHKETDTRLPKNVHSLTCKWRGLTLDGGILRDRLAS